MPYVDLGSRNELEAPLSELAFRLRAEAARKGGGPAFAGLLNYCCTELALRVMPETRYWTFALLKGVFGDIPDEIRRRLTNLYEDKQIMANGDIPSFVRLLPQVEPPDLIEQ